MRKWDHPINLQSLKDRSTTNYKSQPLHSRMKKRSFDVSDLEGANDGFFA